jgi:hypothetical protein
MSPFPGYPSPHNACSVAMQAGPAVSARRMRGPRPERQEARVLEQRLLVVRHAAFGADDDDGRCRPHAQVVQARIRLRPQREP